MTLKLVEVDGTTSSVVETGLYDPSPLQLVQITNALKGDRGASGGSFGYYQITDLVDTEINPMEVNAGQIVDLSVVPSSIINLLKTPFDQHNFWNQQRIRPHAVEDVFLIRLQLRTRSLAQNGSFSIDVNIGPNSSASVFSDTFAFNAFVEKKHTFNSIIYTGSTLLENGARLLFKPTVDCEVYQKTLVFVPVSIT